MTVTDKEVEAAIAGQLDDMGYTVPLALALREARARERIFRKAAETYTQELKCLDDEEELLLAMDAHDAAVAVEKGDGA